MSTDWESIFNSWSKSPGKTEAGRIENAVVAVRKALDADDFLAENTRVFVQGSYRNRVNARQESDVDIGVLYTGTSFCAHYPPGKTHEDFGHINATYTYMEFKDCVGSALMARFGCDSVERGNKAFDIHANTYRVDADVVPLFVHRRYSNDGTFICGVQLNTDDGKTIPNWPERLVDNPYWPRQHYENGVSKNGATSRGYKGVVRILKKLRHMMVECGFQAAKPVPGFVVECLVWNVPDDYLMQDSWAKRVELALLYLRSRTKTLETCKDWREVSNLKYIFRGSSSNKLRDAHAFIKEALSFTGNR